MKRRNKLVNGVTLSLVVLLPLIKNGTQYTSPGPYVLPRSFVNNNHLLTWYYKVKSYSVHPTILDVFTKPWNPRVSIPTSNSLPNILPLRLKLHTPFPRDSPCVFCLYSVSESMVLTPTSTRSLGFVLDSPHLSDLTVFP